MTEFPNPSAPWDAQDTDDELTMPGSDVLDDPDQGDGADPKLDYFWEDDEE